MAFSRFTFITFTDVGENGLAIDNDSDIKRIYLKAVAEDAGLKFETF